jgi:hypothetical protein
MFDLPLHIPKSSMRDIHWLTYIYASQKSFFLFFAAIGRTTRQCDSDTRKLPKAKSFMLFSCMLITKVACSINNHVMSNEALEHQSLKNLHVGSLLVQHIVFVLQRIVNYTYVILFNELCVEFCFLFQFCMWHLCIFRT